LPNFGAHGVTDASPDPCSSSGTDNLADWLANNFVADWLTDHNITDHLANWLAHDVAHDFVADWLANHNITDHLADHSIADHLADHSIADHLANYEQSDWISLGGASAVLFGQPEHRVCELLRALRILRLLSGAGHPQY
jgi:hypothetical protein